MPTPRTSTDGLSSNLNCLCLTFPTLPQAAWATSRRVPIAARRALPCRRATCTTPRCWTTARCSTKAGRMAAAGTVSRVRSASARSMTTTSSPSSTIDVCTVWPNDRTRQPALPQPSPALPRAGRGLCPPSPSDRYVAALARDFACPWSARCASHPAPPLRGPARRFVSNLFQSVTGCPWRGIMFL